MCSPHITEKFNIHLSMKNISGKDNNVVDLVYKGTNSEQDIKKLTFYRHLFEFFLIGVFH